MNGDDALAVIKSNNQTLFTINDIYTFSKTIEPKAVRSSSMKFIEESVKNFFLKTEFNGLYSYIDQEEDPQEDGHRGLNITCCKIPEDNIHTYLVAFYLKFLSFPLFWKDYICIFYIALKQFSKIKSNSQSVSRIICLGESPMKIVFIQEFFFKNEFIKDALITKNYATNVSFEYFSMSRLQTGITKLYHTIEPKYSSLHTLFTATPGDFLAVNTKIIELFIGSSNPSVLAYFNVNVNVIGSTRKQQNDKDIFDKIAGHFTQVRGYPEYKVSKLYEEICEGNKKRREEKAAGKEEKVKERTKAKTERKEDEKKANEIVKDLEKDMDEDSSSIKVPKRMVAIMLELESVKNEIKELKSDVKWMLFYMKSLYDFEVNE